MICPNGSQTPTIERWLNDVRACCSDSESSLLPLFETYAAEAAFGRNYIAPDLENLPPGAKILEVGAGSLLLSCQLVREGYRVTALEPVGSGFSHFDQMRQIVMARAAELECLPENLKISAEDLMETCRFDYAFSINVMEHVSDISRVVANVERSLVIGASYRFTAPNYLFPYEPHFNIPTLFSKKLTEKVFSRRIFGCAKMSDPAGTWESLNWITVIQIKEIVQKYPGLKVTFNRRLLVETIERIVSDPIFSSRRSPVVRYILLLLIKLQIHPLFRFMPPEIQPIMDCRLHKQANTELS